MPRPTSFNDRMSDSDAIIWKIESDPALRSTILCVWVLDRAPDWDRFSTKFERCVREIPRLRQRPVSDPVGLAPPSWEDDPNFDLAFHMRRLTAPGDGSQRALLDMAQPIGMQAFDRDRPLWELYVVDGLAGGRTGIIMKLHHAVSDGVGLVRMTEGMIERSPEADAKESEPLPAAPEAQVPDGWQRLRRAAADRVEQQLTRARSTAQALGTGLASLLRSPVETARSVSSQLASVGRLLAPVTEPLSPVMRERSLSVHYDSLNVPLAELKRAAKAVGGTVNDAFVAAVTGGLRHYHEQLGEPVDELRMNMPINMRSGSKSRHAGNQFAPVRFAVPISIADPAERMRRIRELVAEQRAEPALPWIDPISAAMGSLPGNGPALLSGAMMKAIDFTTSNVPGPRFPVYVSGARIESMFGFGPLAGAASNVTCFSYDGTLGIGINVDPAAVTDPALFVECMRKGLDEVLAVV
jgi:WS/DGAT/MGAT family acyltransferase